MAWSTAALRVGFLKNSPLRMALVMATESWSTMRPAPMFWWPTSLLPMVPSGRPTSKPLVWMSVLGYSAMMRSSVGVLGEEDGVALVQFGVGVVAPAIADDQDDRTLGDSRHCSWLRVKSRNIIRKGGGMPIGD